MTDDDELHRPVVIRRTILGLALGFVYLQRTAFSVWPHLTSTPGDFGNYYLSARSLLHGQSPFVNPACDYPPLLSFVVAPFACVALGPARVAWFLFGQACLLAAAHLLWRFLGGDFDAALVVGCVWALSGTVPANLALGQVHPLLLLLLVFSMRSATSRPERSAAALGVAAGLKIWPGVVLFVHLVRGRAKALSIGLAAALLLIFGPWLLLRAFFPPPHWATRSGYWLGTPATLNLSLPATVSRIRDAASLTGPIDHPPADWVNGNDPQTFRGTRASRAASVVISLSTLLVGLGFVAYAVRRGAPAHQDATLMAALVSVSLLAAPIAWYHYQIFQLPGFAILATAYWRRGNRVGLALVAALDFALTESDLVGRALTSAGFGEVMSILLLGIVTVVCGAALMGLLLREARRTDPSKEER